MEQDKILLNCPFCGGKPKLLVKQDQRVFPHFVECTACGVQTDYYGARSEAVNVWNRRPEKRHG